LEVKSAAQWKPVQWLRELDAEMLNDRTAMGAVVAAPKGTLEVDEWVVILHPQVWLKLMRDAGYLCAPNADGQSEVGISD
jgi:hypothetical protein